MTEAENSIIMEIFLTVFSELNEATFSWESPQTEYENWDSFAHLRIITEIEKRFEVKLDMDDVIYITNAKGFLELITKKNSE